MSLNPAGTVGTNWNFTKLENDGFSLELWGTIVCMQEVQAREFVRGSGQPGRPDFWPDGNPKMNIRVGFATPDGSLKTLTFMKAGKAQRSGQKPSLHMQLFAFANGNMSNLMGKTFHIVTWQVHPGFDERLGFDTMGNPLPWNTDEKKGWPWQQGNPRLFFVEEVTDTRYELSAPLPDEFKVPEVYCNDAASGGQFAQPQAVAPQNIQPNQAPPMQGGYYAPPQPIQQAPQVQQPMPQQMPQQAPMPQGMDPAVAQAMQAVGAVNVQPVSAEVYTDIPW